MKKSIVSAGLSVIAVLLVAVSASLAQGGESVDVFWARFKSAVLKSDKAGVAAMSQFPIEMSYGIPAIKNRSQLLRRYRELFSVQADARKCFADAQPVIDSNDKNRFTVGCKDIAGDEVVIYGFVRTRTGWKLNSLDNINE